jgi:lipopolysaccharide/colanic/teichoic acid biosynthesis glycosyltransferase
MIVDNHHKRIGLTMSGDARITPVGRLLRSLKFDELPQFYNVLRGEMSIVGPRPKLPEYADEMNLTYRPGLTGAATLSFRREEEILAQVDLREMEHFYLRRIKPLKALLDNNYMERATFSSDLKIIVSTILSYFMTDRYPATMYDDFPNSEV